MAIPEKTSGPSKKSRHDRLTAIIRDRLELDEEWFPVTERPEFFGEIENLRLSAFENAFGQMVRLGCKWEILLTCLARCHTYNTEEIVLEKARYDSEGKLSTRPRTRRQPMSRPPGKDERDSFRRSLDGAFGRIKRYPNLLFELGQFDAPPSILGPHLSADEALVYLPKLLKWCRRLLSEDSLGNFSTVESVGQLVPCVYVDVVTPRKDSIRDRRLALKPVADLLRDILGESRYKQDQLREALSRFQRQYPTVYRQLRAKIEDLHRASHESPDGWRRVFAAEARRRLR